MVKPQSSSDDMEEAESGLQWFYCPSNGRPHLLISFQRRKRTRIPHLLGYFVAWMGLLTIIVLLNATEEAHQMAQTSVFHRGALLTSQSGYDGDKELEEDNENDDELGVNTAALMSQIKIERSQLTYLERLKLHFPPIESLLSNHSSGQAIVLSANQSSHDTTTRSRRRAIGLPRWFRRDGEEEEEPLPAANKSADEDEIIGDVRFLLDFAILGHAKCATSFLMQWLNAHPQVKMWDREVCHLSEGRPATLARRLYEEFPQGLYQRGFKCPGHCTRHTLRLVRQYFGRTKIIVGLRHPVRWFESYYNFRYRHPKRANMTLPEPETLTPAYNCTSNVNSQGVCTDHANFHTHLSMFGKTNMTDRIQLDLLTGLKSKYKHISPITNPVFLYDVAQLQDDNETRTDRFRADLQDFLGLDLPLENQEEPSSGDETVVAPPPPKATRLDICQPQYRALRSELLVIGKHASHWIRTYFLQSEEVFVSDRAYFESSLAQWSVDPCLGAILTSDNLVIKS